MSARLLRDILILLAVGLAVAVGFYFWNPDLEESTKVDRLINREQEAELGDFLLTLMQNEFEEVEDTTDVDYVYVQSLVDHLLEHSDMDTYDYKLHLMESSQVNAFATVDGHVFVLRGMIDLCDNSEQLASVLAHEIGHIEEHHVLEKLVREFGMMVLLEVSTGGGLGSDISRLIFQNSFSRLAEKEADNFGLYMMIQAGIHPKYMGDLMEALEEYQLDMGVPDLAFFNTHPATEDRKLEAWSYEVPEDFEAKQLPPMPERETAEEEDQEEEDEDEDELEVIDEEVVWSDSLDAELDSL